MLTSSQRRQLAEELPKIELHLHLDGSLSPEFLERQSSLQQIPLPVPAAELEHWFQEQKRLRLEKGRGTAQETVPSRNWNTFNFCNSFLQTSEALQESVEDLLRRLRSRNVVYAEIRFCPQLHTDKGLSCREAVEAVVRGFRSQAAILGGVILCALRSLPESHGIETAGLAKEFFNEKDSQNGGVLGMDVAGDEALFPLDSEQCPMYKGVALAGELGIPLTVHAGEWPDETFGTIKNLEFAFEQLGARRLGHGLALGRHPDVLEGVRRRGNVTVEVCLSSNIAFNYKVKSWPGHPVRAFFAHRLPFSLSCDNTLLSGDFENRPGPTEEILHLVEDVFGAADESDPLIGWKAVRFSLLSGARAAFSQGVQKKWIDDFQQSVDTTFAKFGLCVSTE